MPLETPGAVLFAKPMQGAREREREKEGNDMSLVYSLSSFAVVIYAIFVFTTLTYANQYWLNMLTVPLCLYSHTKSMTLLCL